MSKILVVDDEKSFTELLEIALRREGYSVKIANSGTEALQLLKNTAFDLVICDNLMPDIAGLQILDECKNRYPGTKFILITAYASFDTAMDAYQLGADFITKPTDMEYLKQIVRTALTNEKKIQPPEEPEEATAKGWEKNRLIGRSPKLLEICRLISPVAPTDSTVLITGESGTGKELIARAIHERSKRKDNAFVPVNCGAFPKDLLESLLFGHEKGAFTGADASKMGFFEAADKGTIFLDEIGEMSLEMQVKLLRVLQDRVVRRVGSTKETPIDVRIIAATNQDLRQARKKGTFREDLYFRLAVIEIDLPPLRERIEDLRPLVEHFVKKYSQKVNKVITGVSEEAFRCLERYSWPGNIRELENYMERAVTIEQSGNEIQVERLPDHVVHQPEPQTNHLEPDVLLPEQGIDLEGFFQRVERDLIRQALDRTHGRHAEAAKLLNLTYRQFRHKLDKIKRNGEYE